MYTVHVPCEIYAMEHQNFGPRFFDKKAQGKMRDSSGSKKLVSNSELYTGFR